MTKLTRENAEDAAHLAAEWIASPEGRKALREGEDRAREMIEHWREAERVDWRILYRPFTI